MHYVNMNATRGGPVVAFYSTPSHYTDLKHAETLKAHATWEVRSDDIFPLADNAHAYWSGYFTQVHKQSSSGCVCFTISSDRSHCLQLPPVPQAPGSLRVELPQRGPPDGSHY